MRQAMGIVGSDHSQTGGAERGRASPCGGDLVSFEPNRGWIALRSAMSGKSERSEHDARATNMGRGRWTALWKGLQDGGCWRIFLHS